MRACTCNLQLDRVFDYFEVLLLLCYYLVLYLPVLTITTVVVVVVEPMQLGMIEFL